MKKLVCILIVVSTFSCRQAKVPAESAQLPAEGPLRQVVYIMEVIPPHTFQGFVSYYKEDGQRDSTLFSPRWRYEFKAKAGTVLKVNATARPINPFDLAPGIVRLNIFVDSKEVDSSAGKRLRIEHQVK